MEVDDDVVNAPPDWDLTLRDAFVRLPKIGFLAADLEDDPHDQASHVRHHVRPHEYTVVEENGVRLLRGPAGGGCAMTSRELNERVGGFRESKKHIFWLEDEAYIKDIEKLGYECGVLGRSESASHRWAVLLRGHRREDGVLDTARGRVGPPAGDQEDRLPPAFRGASQCALPVVPTA